MKGKHWLLVLFSVLILFTLGCNFFTNLLKGKPSAVSTVAPTLPAPPKPASAMKGTPEEQAKYFADLLTSPDTRLAGWLGLYDALGIPIIGQDGAALGSTGDDPIGPRYWQIWYASGLDKKGRGIPVSDAGRLLAAGAPELDGGAFGPVLLNDLRLAVKSSDPQVRLMGEFVRERIKRWPSRLDIQDAAVKPDEAIIDLPTIQMIAWIAMRGELFQAAAAGARTSVRTPPAALAMFQPPFLAMFQRPVGNPASLLPCSEKMGDADSTYWTNWLMNKVIAGGVQLPGMTKAFTGLIEQFQKISTASEKMIEKTSAVITKLNIASVLLSLILQIAAMEINPTQNPDPLERTKSTSRGKDGAITLQLYSAPEDIPDGNKLGACMGAFFSNAFGVSFSFPPSGPISGAEMTVSGGQGFPDLVLFNTEGTNSMRRWTKSDGSAEYKIFGAPQKRQIPETAEPVGKEFSVHVKAQPEEAGLNSMLNIFFGGLTFGAAPSKAGGFGSAIDIAKGFQYDMGEYVFRLTDWKAKGYRASGQVGDSVFSGVICSLEKPFTVNATWMPNTPYAIKFVPSSATTGTLSFAASWKAITMNGSGSYTIEGADTDKPRIRTQVTTKATMPVGGVTRSGTGDIILTPLETDECH